MTNLPRGEHRSHAGRTHDDAGRPINPDGQWWACEHPERPSDDLLNWVGNCAGCRLSMAVRVIAEARPNDPCRAGVEREATRRGDVAVLALLARHPCDD